MASSAAAADFAASLPSSARYGSAAAIAVAARVDGSMKSSLWDATNATIERPSISPIAVISGTRDHPHHAPSPFWIEPTHPIQPNNKIGRDEYGFTGGLTIVKDYVAGWRQRAQEMFVPRDFEKRGK
jgi:hypothetical protein